MIFHREVETWSPPTVNRRAHASHDSVRFTGEPLQVIKKNELWLTIERLPDSFLPFIRSAHTTVRPRLVRNHERSSDLDCVKGWRVTGRKMGKGVSWGGAVGT